MTAEPRATVVVPTRGRVSLTRACLESIVRISAADGVPTEILVIDSSVARDRMALEHICMELGAEYVPGPESVSEKRNLGAARARAAYVMFIDSDCVMAQGCLAAHLATLSDETVHASQGKVLFQGPERLAFRAVRCSGLLNAFVPADGAVVSTAAAGNLMVRRSTFLALRFDARLGPPGLGGEDVDFGLRLLARGLRFVGTPSAVVHHETLTWNSVTANLRRFVAWGRSEAHLIERHASASYVDMPSPVLVALALSLAIGVASVFSVKVIIAAPIGFLTYAGILACVGARRNPHDRPGGALAHWVFVALDAGRVFESVATLRPSTAFKRLRFTENQIADEWAHIIPVAWSAWLTTMTLIVVLWWSVR